MIRCLLPTLTLALTLSVIGCVHDPKHSSDGNGGNGGKGGESASADASLPCDVGSILTKNCLQCHSDPPSFGAPMPLVSEADFLAKAKSDPSQKVSTLVEARIHDANHPMPQSPNPPLSAADLQTLDTWIAASTPTGNCQSATTSSSSGGPTISCTPDTHIAPTTPFTMPDDADELYVCYGFEAPAGAKRHIVGFLPHIDDASILHHISLLESDTPVSSTPAVCPLGGSTTWRVVFGWAPGAQGFEMPPEAGFAEDSATHFVVQAHYSNPTHKKPAVDASGFDLCTTTELRPNDADVMAFGTVAISLPPDATTDLDCTVPVPSWGATTHLFAAFPHMHKLGTSITTMAHPGGGTTSVDLGTQPHWNFGEQAWMPINDLLLPGDTVETHCVWDNTTDATVTFGENTSNEMCYSFVMYYPKITDPAWNWAYPALYSQCH
jgi:Copper type II ascorbate-dependent monooxygenase, N-terminal domain/Copper type II ascorbate-dependent monooxygenase, C-terminal domain